MTIHPQLDEKSISYVLETVQIITESTENRRAGGKGEEQTQHIFLNELMKYCDDTSEQHFLTHPGAGTITHKILCVLLIASVFLFSVSVSGGFVGTAVLSLLLNLGVFVAFAYKFIFDGTGLDAISPKRTSTNILGRRFSAGSAQARVVLVTRSDAPLSFRTFILGNAAPTVISLCSILGNTVLFCSQLVFLFSGAPIADPRFEMMRIACLAFLPLYIFGLIIINPKKTSSGISSSLIPTSIALSILKQFSEDSLRYEKTELCVLVTGSEYSGRAGSYAFAKKYKRLFSDIPTYFIPVEEITTSDKLSVFFKDGSGNHGSADIASVIGQAAENLQLPLSKENTMLGTAAFTPFTINHYPACSIGTSKKHISKTVSPTADKITSIKRKTIGDVGALIIEALNYFDS